MNEVSRTAMAADLASPMPTASEDAHTIMLNRVSWGAVFAGVVVGLVVQVLLTMLGVGAGLATLDPGSGDSPGASSFSIGAGIWYALSGLIAAFAGGYVAARMSGKTDATSGALHGLAAWAFTTLLVLYLLTTTLGAIVGGVFNGVAGTAGGLGQTIAATAGPVIAETNPLERLEAQVRGVGADPEAQTMPAVNAIRGLIMSDEAGADAARQQAVEALATARGVPTTVAAQQIETIEQQYRQTVDQAKAMSIEAADATAAAVSTGAIVAFVVLVLGAIASWIGGRSGVVHPVFADRLLPARNRL